MDSNKQRWAKRHAEGKTKLDVATETQMSADAASIANTIDKAEKKKRKIAVDAKAEAAEAGAIKAERENRAAKAKTTEVAEKIVSDAKALANDVKKGNVPTDAPEIV